MKTISLILAMVGGLLFSSTAQANITAISLASDGDNAIVCPIYTWNGSASEVTMSISGDQYWQPAHVIGSIQTDSETADPSLTLSSSINNDTTFAWTAYIVNVYMNTTFTISGAAVSVPGDWSAATTQPIWNGSQYAGQVLFAAGTPVAIGGQLDFAYTISFAGATSYSFTQEMIPVPEPGICSFLAAGALLLGGVLAGRRRTKLS